MDYIYGSHIAGEFDVQVDGNNHWDDTKVCEIDVYPVSLSNEGFHETDTMEPLASREVPTGEYSDDGWYMLPSSWDALKAMPKPLPENILKAVEQAVAEATAKQKLFTGKFRYAVGDTIFIPEHRFPGEIEAHTVNGGYIVEMANSGELAEFAPDELEDYDDDLWNRA
jgi:hypothetical protein